MVKKSFVLYTEQKAIFEKLSDEQAGRLIKAIYEYVEKGNIENVDEITNIIITPFITILDKDMKKYEETSRKRAEAGAKGAKQRVANQANAKNAKQRVANQAEYDNEYDNDNDNIINNIVIKESKKEKKLTSKNTYNEILNEKIQDDNLKKALIEFIKMRKLIKAPLTDNALELAIKKLGQLAPNNVAKQIEIVQQSVMKSWKGLFPLKEEVKEIKSSITKAEEEFLKDE